MPPGSTAHPLSGVIVDEVTPALARQMDLPVNAGLVVTDIEDGSLAEVSGLQPGDLLLELNRQPIPNFSTFQRLAEPLRSRISHSSSSIVRAVCSTFPSKANNRFPPPSTINLYPR
jgi:S1-C subfamily serine protease